MGVFGSILLNIRSFADESKEEAPAALRKKHGFANFDAEMERLRTYDPAVEQANVEPSKVQRETASQLDASPRRGRK